MVCPPRSLHSIFLKSKSQVKINKNAQGVNDTPAYFPSNFLISLFKNFLRSLSSFIGGANPRINPIIEMSTLIIITR